VRTSWRANLSGQARTAFRIGTGHDFNESSLLDGAKHLFPNFGSDTGCSRESHRRIEVRSPCTV
jgi:hypothetical protein